MSDKVIDFSEYFSFFHFLEKSHNFIISNLLDELNCIVCHHVSVDHARVNSV